MNIRESGSRLTAHPSPDLLIYEFLNLRLHLVNGVINFGIKGYLVDAVRLAITAQQLSRGSCIKGRRTTSAQVVEPGWIGQFRRVGA
ncbi:hypothetical protein M514_00452 [Trichuris suis]|uniref:Uncharacterized protein n=1 Tax=Trichuris suis TaxID=68888 RepID=A0A085MNG3_9BILA|nr:hypothetical protein M513_00452 [Trichuris suis]KFD72039.1 hypothetical protein M514_00452 [Trichuris suis]